MHATDPSVARSRGRRLPRLAACAALAVATSGVAAAQGSAATIAVGSPCVVNANPAEGTPMAVAGADFTAGDTINVTSTTGDAFSTLPITVAADGTWTTIMPAPTLSTLGPGAQTFTLQAMDETDGVTTATTTVAVANLAVAWSPAEAKPKKKVTWSFSGFTPGAPVYAHYLHRNKVIATASFGHTSGPCGLLKKRAVFFPGHSKYSTYKMQIDDSHHYSAKALPRVLASLTTNLF